MTNKLELDSYFTMTEEQIKMLRTLIQGEIEYAMRSEHITDVFAFEQEKANDQGWNQFKESFNGH